MLNLNDSSTKRLVTWAIICLLFPLIFLNGWLVLKVLDYFQPLVTVFVLAALLALILNFPVQFLRQRGLKRSQAVLLIVGVMLLALMGLGIVVIPVLLEDIGEIIQVFPEWLQSASQQLQMFQGWLVNRGLPVSVGRVMGQLANSLPNALQTLADNAVTFLLGTVDSVSEVILAIVLAFYFLADGERLADEVFQRLPAHLGTPVRRSLQHNFQNFFIGQASLALLVGVLITTAFLIIQIPYALLAGITVSVMGLIPYGDIVTCTLISILLGFQDVWLGLKVLAIAVTIDQITDQLIAPRLLGKFTGLRPVWVFLSLLLGTKVAGLLGLLVAVPVASFVKDALNGFLLEEAEAIEQMEGTSKMSTPIDAPNPESQQLNPLV